MGPPLGHGSSRSHLSPKSKQFNRMLTAMCYCCSGRLAVSITRSHVIAKVKPYVIVKIKPHAPDGQDLVFSRSL